MSDADRGVLQQFLFGSPKFRQVAIEVMNRILNSPVDSKRNTVVYGMAPMEMEWLNKLLGFLGVKTVLLRSREKLSERFERIESDFNESNGVVLLCPFALRMEGLNLDRFCSNVIMLSQP